MAKTIMVVDDEKRLVSLVESYLSQEGYRVVTAYNGKEALAVAQKEHPDLIILDVMMEDCAAGFRVVNQLRDAKALGFHPGHENVPILMLTNVQQHLHLKLEQHARTSLMNVDEFVEKPIEPRRLLERVAALLAG